MRHVLLSLLVAVPLQARSSEEVVLRLDAEWARSYAQHDTATAIALFDDHIIVTSGTGSLKDKNGELADIRPTAGLQMHYFRTSGVGGRLTGSAAAVAGLAGLPLT